MQSKFYFVVSPPAQKDYKIIGPCLEVGKVKKILDEVWMRDPKFKRAYLRERAKIDKQIDKFTKDQSARKEILQTGKK